MSTSTTSTVAATAATPVTKRSNKWLFRKQLLIWLPQVVSTLIFWLLLPCDHPFLSSGGPWRNVIPEVLDFSRIKSVTASLFVVNSIMYLSLFATVILILIGTLQFLMEARSTQHNNASEATGAFVLTVISLGLVGVWAISILTTDQRFWIIEKLGIEGWSLSIFVVFGAIDLLYWISFKKELPSKQGIERKSTEMKKAFSANSFWLIDAPVIVGVLSVWLVTHYMSGEPALHELTIAGRDSFNGNGRALLPHQQDQIFQTFLNGFSTGAIIMHMAFSQFIFGILKTRDLRKRFKAGLANDLYV